MRRIEIDIAEVERLAGLGLPIADICRCIGVCERTLYTRKKQSADLNEAILRGRASMRESISNTLFDLAVGGNVTACIWIEKTRFGITEDAELLRRIERLEQLLQESHEARVHQSNGSAA